ncbi:hypothetical protein A15D_00662 [Alcanivorax sp. MD8A]|uniref:hypothetical protein n=1 Tax=Alcanivorax sp. MD8A TaxID=1177157 RepID=UPI000C9CC39A|nr:hypothetical protein [Alcanivorax sp. MD8A]MEE2871220.1 hypothetical protein [Pseudomonadota bacterium]PNE03746.1 hypothetical protein A15D_00662 [Alcanivorax sp. MD8A]
MKSLLVVFFLLLTGAAQAGIVVVVSKSSDLAGLTRNEVRQIFNGQLNRVGEVSVKPLDMPVAASQRELFYQRVMGKSVEQMKSYWARMIFTGRGMPPREVSSDREMTLLVGSDRHFIGYMDEADVTSDLKVVFRP